MPTVQHFEIPADDTRRAQNFYNEVFGWGMQRWNNPTDPSQDYIMFETKDDEGNKGIGGGLMKPQSPNKQLLIT